jgi:hypothetical protein
VYAAKHTAEKESLPWVKPSDYEIQASVEMLVSGKPPASNADIGVLFLVDGSGSVQEGRLHA